MLHPPRLCPWIRTNVSRQDPFPESGPEGGCSVACGGGGEPCDMGLGRLACTHRSRETRLQPPMAHPMSLAHAPFRWGRPRTGQARPTTSRHRDREHCASACTRAVDVARDPPHVPGWRQSV